MFENCGSCFAAEQFVDIRLGAKYLLTLTSYYYEREWKFMAMITLQNSRNAEVTVLTNNFIDNYMPGANGEFVKVYIYLLRLLSDTSVPFSLEQMADHFFCTERDIIRALKYWEKEKLLTLTYRNNEDIADIILNVPPVKSAASDFNYLDLQIIKINLLYKIILIKSGFSMFLKMSDCRFQPDWVSQIHFITDTFQTTKNLVGPRIFGVIADYSIFQ